MRGTGEKSLTTVSSWRQQMKTLWGFSVSHSFCVRIGTGLRLRTFSQLLDKWFETQLIRHGFLWKGDEETVSQMTLLAGILLVVVLGFLLFQFSVTYWKYCKLLLMQQKKHWLCWRWWQFLHWCDNGQHFTLGPNKERSCRYLIFN